MSLNACTISIRNQKNIFHQSWKYSEKYYTMHNTFTHTKWFYQSPQIRSQSHILSHASKKTTKYKVPKTWRKVFELIKEANRTNRTARRSSTFYASIATITVVGVIGGFGTFLHYFGPAGGGRKWREGI
eukprot:724552_1